MMLFFKWFAGFFEDQGGSASSKRALMYICAFLLWILVKGSLEGKPISPEVLFSVVGLAGWCVGAISSETIGKLLDKEKKQPAQ